MGLKKEFEVINDKPTDLTEEELKELEVIRTISGSGYIRGYHVKMVHVCPSCGASKGQRNFACIKCGYQFTQEDWLEGPHKERWEKI